MPRFQYRIINASGAEEASELEAGNESEAMLELSEKNLMVVELKSVGEKADRGESGGDSNPAALTFGSSLPMKIVLGFYEQLSFLLSSGIPIHLSVRMVLDNCKHPELGKVLTRILFYLTEGNTFSWALEQYPKYFPAIHSKMIGIGEKTGTMDKALIHLKELVEERLEMEGQLVKAASYPLFLVGMSGSLGFAMILVVFPKFQEIFSSMETKLPALTVTLMKLSDVMRTQLGPLSVAIVAAVGGLAYFLMSSAMMETRERAIIATPAIGTIFLDMFVAQFAKTLSGTLKSGIPLLDALVIVMQTIPNGIRQRFVADLILAVKEGESLSSSMKKTHFVPELVWQLTAVGEQTGDLGVIMENVFIYYKKKYVEALERVNAVIKPTLMISAAIFIGVIAGALFIPMFKMGSGMKRGD